MPKNQYERSIDISLKGQAAGGGTIIVNGGGGGNGGGTPVMEVHDLSGPYHSGSLDWSKLNKGGSSLGDLQTRSHALLTGIGPDDHHDQVHVLATTSALGPDHTVNGLEEGMVLAARSPQLAAFGFLSHFDLVEITPDQHHVQQHEITDPDHHTFTPSDELDLVGAVTPGVIGRIQATHDPGAARRILRTDDFGSLYLGTDTLVVDSATGNVGVNVLPNGSTALWAASRQIDDVTLRVRQKSGQTARMVRFDEASGRELVVVTNNGTLQSGNPGFVSGLTGWQITPEGNVEFNDGWFRGELHATVFVADELHATGGSLMVATAGKLFHDAVIGASAAEIQELEVVSSAIGVPKQQPIDAVTSKAGWVNPFTVKRVLREALQVDGSGLNPRPQDLTFVSSLPAVSGSPVEVRSERSQIDLEQPPSGLPYFRAGEVVRAKTIDLRGGALHVYDLWLRINTNRKLSEFDREGRELVFFRYDVERLSGSNTTLPAGTAVVSYGFVGEGRILLTSDLNYAPYIDVFSVGPNVWAGQAGSIIPRMRMGRLDGVGVAGVGGIEQYGMIAGSDLSNADSPHFIASDKQFKLFKIDLELNDGANPTVLMTKAGEVKFGKDARNVATTGFRFDPLSGDTIMGNVALGQYVRWDQAASLLRVRGDILIEDLSIDYDNVVGAPQDLGDLDPTADTKLTGIEAGATVGAIWSGVGANVNNTPTAYRQATAPANPKLYDTWLNTTTQIMSIWTGASWVAMASEGADWQTNLLNTPVRFGEAPVAAGLYLTANRMGYWNGSQWTAFINNQGQFSFGGTTNTQTGGLTGSRLEYTGGSTGVLRGVDAAGEVQWAASAGDGAIYAGDNGVRLNVDGVALRSNFPEVSAPEVDVRRSNISLYKPTFTGLEVGRLGPGTDVGGNGTRTRMAARGWQGDGWGVVELYAVGYRNASGNLIPFDYPYEEAPLARTSSFRVTPYFASLIGHGLALGVAQTPPTSATVIAGVPEGELRANHILTNSGVVNGLLSVGGTLALQGGALPGASPDTDSAYTFGRAALGGFATDRAGFVHFNHRDVQTSFALRQDANGQTRISGAPQPSDGASVILAGRTDVSNQELYNIYELGLREQAPGFTPLGRTFQAKLYATTDQKVWARFSNGQSEELTGGGGWVQVYTITGITITAATGGAGTEGPIATNLFNPVGDFETGLFTLVCGGWWTILGTYSAYLNTTQSELTVTRDKLNGLRSTNGFVQIENSETTTYSNCVLTVYVLFRQ